ncbi:hypothetical protein GIB67_026430 [Kingdonia uniflora]|uniref:peptidyl-tRNA hydrolase n=1 Tax=Kingdonia uniflora TaxID=39325 RepID=A0A7J7P6N4_9MAGN|nr:hypothetical protein GIB67_026430 [Kingdonia uniflora]
MRARAPKKFVLPKLFFAGAPNLSGDRFPPSKGCLALSYLICTRRLLRRRTAIVDDQRHKMKKDLLEVEKLAEILENFKMVLVVRNDLKMGKGKIAAQCR